MFRHYYQKNLTDKVGYLFSNKPTGVKHPDNIWFISDTHFYHEKIIQHTNRPFASVSEMNTMMVDRWNALVGMNDVVYHIGDFSLRDDPHCVDMIDNLNGTLYLIAGNHDRDKILKAKRWKAVYDMLTVKVEPDIEIILCHYPLERWPKSHYGAYHFHGHTHGTLRSTGRRQDVGVDVWGFAPVSLARLIDFLKPATVELPI